MVGGGLLLLATTLALGSFFTVSFGDINSGIKEAKVAEAYNDKDLTLVGNIANSDQWNVTPNSGNWRFSIQGDTDHFKLEHVYMVAHSSSDFRIIPWGDNSWPKNMGYSNISNNEPGFTSAGVDNNIRITKTSYYNIYLWRNTSTDTWVIDIYYDQSRETPLECQIWLDNTKLLDAGSYGFDFTFGYDDDKELAYSDLPNTKIITAHNYKKFYVIDWTCTSDYYLTDYRIGYTDNTSPYNSPGSTAKNYARAQTQTNVTNYIMLYFVTASTHTNYYFFNGDGWSGDMYMYLGNGALGSWPGTKMMSITGKANTYTMTVSKSYDTTNTIIVFNNNSGSKTSDLSSKGNGMHVFLQKSGFYGWYLEGGECETVLLKGDPNSWEGVPMRLNIDETGASFKGTIAVSSTQCFKVNNLSSGSNAWYGWSDVVDYDNSARRKGQIVAASSNNNIQSAKTCSFDIYFTLSDLKLYIPSSLYNVTLVTNGGTISSGNVTQYYYGVGATLPNSSQISKSGYAFRGWYDNVNFHGDAITKITSTDANDKTYYAYWKQLFTVSFNANGHGTAPSSQQVANGEKATAPTAPTATGYTFGGWYKESSCTNAWNFSSDVVTSNKILYAKWTLNKYKVTISVSGSGGSINKTAINNVPHGSTVTVNGNVLTINGTTVTATVDTPPSGFKNSFNGWSNVPETITGTVTITANFSQVSGRTAAMEYAIAFNSAISEACDYAGGTNVETLADAWSSQATAYGNLEAYVQYWVLNDGEVETIVNMRRKYDYVYGKYGTEIGQDFLGRTPAPVGSIRSFTPFELLADGDGENTASTILIIVASATSILSVTALSILLVRKRKRKENN